MGAFMQDLRKITLLACAAAAVGQSATTLPIANTLNGTYAGVYSPTFNQDYFLGIPYAEPPIQGFRLRPPQPLNESWDGHRYAMSYSPECYQYPWAGGEGASDDCLTINIVRPSGIDSDRALPVAMWIHGGGLVEGSNSVRNYNLSFIVDQSVLMGQPVIATSINYRLGAWGYLWGSEMEKVGAGNLGYRDQRIALEWLQENIAAFGGDPAKVTIWGQSGGARGVASQITAYAGRDDGLFRAAVLQSATGFHTSFGEIYVPGAATWDEAFEDLVEKTGCSAAGDRLQCLRELPSLELAKIFDNVTFPPFLDIVDGDFIQAPRADLIRDGAFNHVPVLIGNVHDEGQPFAPYGINTTAEWETAVQNTDAADNTTLDVLSALYPDNPRVGLPPTLYGRPEGDLAYYGAQWKRANAYFGDRAMHAPRRFWTRRWAEEDVLAYSYHFNVRSADLNLADGSRHSSEMPFVFHNIDGVGYEVSPFEGAPESYYELAKIVSRAWVGFFNHMDPNKGGLGCKQEWPVYGGEDPKNMVFNANLSSLVALEGDTYRTEQIEYLINKLWV